MTPFEKLQDWKNKPYRRTNYENIYAFYDECKYIRMKPNSYIINSWSIALDNQTP